MANVQPFPGKYKVVIRGNPQAKRRYNSGQTFPTYRSALRRFNTVSRKRMNDPEIKVVFLLRAKR